MRVISVLLVLMSLCLFYQVKGATAKMEAYPKQGITGHIREENSDTYRAAVVEYSPTFLQYTLVNRSTAISIMMSNMDQYEEFIAQAAGNNTQIILFPEDGLYGAAFTREQILPYLEPIPDVPTQSTHSSSQVEYSIPCNFEGIHLLASPVLSRASCLAINYNITIVLDMGEVKPCSKEGDSHCPRDRRYQYNTLVAFSPRGELIAKYHKSHLYYEPQFDAPIVPDVVWFESDFGVKFGLLICFDLMFQHPQQDLYLNHGIRNFLWSSWWVNEPPLITGTQAELARSLAFPSNFLASGIGLSWYNSGSGIYSYGKSLDNYYNIGYEQESRVMIGDLPIAPPMDLEYQRKSVPDQWSPGIHQQATYVEFSIESGKLYQLESESGDLNCQLTIQTSSDSGEGDIFALYALHGLYNDLFPAQICAVFKCAESGCLDPELQTNARFSSWSLSGNLNSDNEWTIYPMVADENCQSVDPSSYSLDDDLFPTSIVSNSTGDHGIINIALFGLEWFENGNL